MDKDKIEKALEVLKCCHDLYNISDELKNRIPDKHHEVISDLILEIDDISNELSELEKDIYYEYLKQCLSELEEEEN